MPVTNTSQNEDTVEPQSKLGSETGTSGTEGDSKDLTRDLAEVFAKIPLPRLFLLLMFLSYMVVAFSKGQQGIGYRDFFLLIGFTLIASIFHFFLKRWLGSR